MLPLRRLPGGFHACYPGPGLPGLLGKIDKRLIRIGPKHTIEQQQLKCHVVVLFWFIFTV